MRRVLCILSCMNAGGAETFLMKIYRQLDRDKFQMDFCINIYDEGYYDKEILELGGKIYHIPSKSENFKEFKIQLSNLIKKGKYETVLRITSNAMGFLDLKIAKKAGAKLCIVRSSNSNDPAGVKLKLAHRLGKVLYGKYVDVKIAPSDLAAIYTFGKKAYKNGDVNILHNALDLDVYKYDLNGRKFVRDELGVADTDILCGHIGRFSKQKNHKFLLDVFSEICKVEKNYKLVLVGKGELEDWVKEYCRKKNIYEKVIFVGIRRDIPAILSAMDIFVFPSLYEGMPNTVIEAQATGLPCIISDTITKEVVLTDLVTMKPINKDTKIWSDSIIEMAKKKEDVNRNKFVNDMRRGGYDIKDCVHQFVNIIFCNRR